MAERLLNREPGELILKVWTKGSLSANNLDIGEGRRTMESYFEEGPFGEKGDGRHRDGPTARR